MDPAKELPKEETFINPKNEITPPAEEKDLPEPHDMLLKDHFTKRHPWVHWVPAIFGLFVGMIAGGVFISGVNRNQQYDNYYLKPTHTAVPTSVVLQERWNTYQNPSTGYTIQYPSDWMYVMVTDNPGFNRVHFKPTLKQYNETLSPDFVEGQNKDFGLIRVDVSDTNLSLQQILGPYCQAPACDPAKAVPVTVNGLHGLQISSPSAFTNIITVFRQEKKTAGSLFNGTAIAISLENLLGHDPFAFISVSERQNIYMHMLSSFISPDQKQAFNPSSTPTVPEQNGVVCTMDVKQCPDGTWVGRTGPRCAFAPCPGI